MITFENIIFYKTEYDNYYLSKCGKVLSLKHKNPKLIKTSIKNNGYEQVNLYLGENGMKKTVLVHRFMAITFIPNIHKKEQINHINGIRHDNRLENLEWSTSSENNKHKFDSLNHEIYNKSNVKIIDNDTCEFEYVCISELIERYKVSFDYIENIRSSNMILRTIYVERDCDAIKSWFNGEVVYSSKEVSDVARYYGVDSYEINRKIKSQRTRLKLNKKYKIIF